MLRPLAYLELLSTANATSCTCSRVVADRRSPAPRGARRVSSRPPDALRPNVQSRLNPGCDGLRVQNEDRGPVFSAPSHAASPAASSFERKPEEAKQEGVYGDSLSTPRLAATAASTSHATSQISSRVPFLTAVCHPCRAYVGDLLASDVRRRRDQVVKGQAAPRDAHSRSRVSSDGSTRRMCGKSCVSFYFQPVTHAHESPCRHFARLVRLRKRPAAGQHDLRCTSTALR